MDEENHAHMSFQAASFWGYLEDAKALNIEVERVLLDYFALSGFYDTTCKNEELQQQKGVRFSDLQGALFDVRP